MTAVFNPIDRKCYHQEIYLWVIPLLSIHTQFLPLIEESNYMSDKLAGHYTDILSILGEDVNRGGLVDTPKRAAKAMQFLTDGYEKDLDGVVNGAIFEADTDEMVIVQDIEFYSLCEHHILPFIGRCHIAYLPNGKVLGLSKFARIVDMYARRLQIQEGLTKQIADAVQQVTGATGVGVIMEGKHMCMMMRGVQKQNSSMITSVMLGSMRTSDATRNEFLRLIGK
ncbi:MAG: GTP cyclohydrolase I [Flavobacteriales bacterium]|jgi:GTP cyclohydrolase I